MFLQNNKELNIDIQKVGCLYLSMLRIYELINNVEISIEDVNEIWKIAKSKNYLNANNDMKDMDAVFRLAKMITGSERLAFTIGLHSDGKDVFWKWTNNKSAIMKVKYTIENLKTKGVEGNHFILCDALYNVLFDSYSFKDYKAEHVGRFHLINHN